MKIAAIALLLSGLFTTTLVPAADLKAENGYGNGRNPWQLPTNSYMPSYRQRWNQGQSNREVYRPYGQPPVYRFRPWAGQNQPPVAQQAYNAYPTQHPLGYRFRPTHDAEQRALQRSVATPAVAYRPASITIPDHYVYRPLNPVKRVKPRTYANNIPPAYPAIPNYGYRAYYQMPNRQPSRATRQVPQRAQPAPRYVYGDGDGRYLGHKFRADPRVYQAQAYTRPIQRMNPMPGYAYNRWPAQLRFRPTRQLRMPQPNYAYLQANRYPARTQSYPVMAAPRSYYPATMPQGYTSWQTRSEPRVSSTPNQVDWYDGRSDGEGAWYKLAQQQNWPEVSHNWSGQNQHPQSIR
jgi:hypothetical protein